MDSEQGVAFLVAEGVTGWVGRAKVGEAHEVLGQGWASLVVEEVTGWVKRKVEKGAVGMEEVLERLGARGSQVRGVEVNLGDMG